MNDFDTFHLRPEAFRVDRRQRIVGMARRLFVLIAVVAGVLVFQLRDQPNIDIVLGVVTLLVVVSIARGVRKAFVRWRVEWESYELVLTDGEVTRRVTGYPPLRIARDEVRAIRELPTGLAVRGVGMAEVWVPRAVEGYEVVRGRLAAWHPFETAVALSRAVVWGVMALGAGWVAAMFWLERVIATKGVERAVPELVVLEALAFGVVVYVWKLRAMMEQRSRRLLVKLAVGAMLAPLLIVAMKWLVPLLAPRGG